jgi:hypothetical protein
MKYAFHAAPEQANSVKRETGRKRLNIVTVCQKWPDFTGYFLF